eukprot:scaffold21896_cov125-Isochrysis_galbana.AAC.1
MAELATARVARKPLVAARCRVAGRRRARAAAAGRCLLAPRTARSRLGHRVCAVCRATDTCTDPVAQPRRNQGGAPFKRALPLIPHSRQPSPPSQQLAGRGMPAA